MFYPTRASGSRLTKCLSSNLLIHNKIILSPGVPHIAVSAGRDCKARLWRHLESMHDCTQYLPTAHILAISLRHHFHFRALRHGSCTINLIFNKCWTRGRKKKRKTVFSTETGYEHSRGKNDIFFGCLEQVSMIVGSLYHLLLNRDPA